MQQLVVDQNLILLDGKPLCFITADGLEQWEAEGTSFKCRYDMITNDGENHGKFRCLYEKDDSQDTYILVESPASPDGFKVILVDHPTDTLH
ncbi:hypothetical protein [Ascidiaceihabitans sp.]|uniref:hypothetical protein n=1 Tax=Ascidiaceihabitans sp. TaxID=1872644 RepID=UPI003298EAAD